MKDKKKSLMRELKGTIFLLSTAMLAMWFLFYAYMHNILKSYITENMEQVSAEIINELDKTFLQLEEVSFALAKDDEIISLMKSDSSLEFHNRTNEIEHILEQVIVDKSFMDNIVFLNYSGDFYRYSGNISNIGISRMTNILTKNKITKHIQLQLDDSRYIGYVTNIYFQQEDIGKIVMLMDETDIYRLFSQLAKTESMKIALAAEGEIIVTNDEVMLGKSMSEQTSQTKYYLTKRVGFTPFELLISYENADRKISLVFLIAMSMMAMLLLLILRVFLHFWRGKFFIPLQTVILEVESFESGKEEILMLTGMEHFDGLIRGINNMIERIELKEKEVYEATYFLQEAEIRKQKALIVSLKKQISAHFTVNVLNIIKALSASGENEKAGLLCDGLSFLLRYANAGDHFISGMDEFFVLEKYVDIMKIRYPNRFEAEIEMEDNLEEIEIPRMLLQPIIENSIIHGFSNKNESEKGLIHVYCDMESSTLRIIIEDDGEGIDEEELINIQEQLRKAEEDDPIEGLSHIAIINIQRRIFSYFGKEYGLTIESAKKQGTTVTIKLPLKHRGF